MLPQLKEDFFHLERSGKGLDEDSASNGTSRDTDVRLRKVEDIIPETGFEVMLHLREVEIGADTASNQFLGIMEEIKRKVEDGCGDRGIIDS